MVPSWHVKGFNEWSICHWNKRIWNFTNLVENSVDFFFQRTKQRLAVLKAKSASEKVSWSCSQWTINHSAHAQLCSTAWKKSFLMAVSLGDSCGCVCQRGGYFCLLAVLSAWYAREHTFGNQHVCTVLSYLAQNIVPDPWKTPAGVLPERDKNEVLHLLKLKCWTWLPCKHLFLRLTVHQGQEEEQQNLVFSPQNLTWISVCMCFSGLEKARRWVEVKKLWDRTNMEDVIFREQI